MKLSMYLIAKYLKKYDPDCHILENRQSIKGVRFFSDQLPSFSLDYVYLGTSRDYYQDPKYEDALLLSNGQNQILCRGADYEELLNDVLSAFEYYNLLEQELLSMGNRHETLSQMLKVLEGFTEDPAAVFDLEGNLLGAASPSSIRDPEFLETIRSRRILGTNIIGRVFEDMDGRISHDLTDQPQFLHTPGSQEQGAIALYLCQEGERVGFILLFPFTRQEAMVWLCLMPVFAKAFAQASEFTAVSSSLQGKQSIFLRLLQKEILPAPVLAKFESRLSFTSSPILLVFRAVMIQNHTFRSMLCKELSEQAAGCLLCEYMQDVVMLTEDSSLRSLRTYLEGSIVHRNVAIGVSMPLQHPEEIPVAYEQAVFAVEATDYPAMRWCRELALPYLLQSLRKKEMALKLLHPALLFLEDYDRENQTDFLETLKVFLTTRCSQKETADRLHIHLNTLKYRLHRISDLCRTDFKDPEELFYMELSIYLKGV